MNYDAFRRFLTDHDLSCTRFAEFCDGSLSRSTIHRLQSADRVKTHSPAFLARTVPELLKHTQLWLALRTSLSHAEIDSTLSDIFEEDYQPMAFERYNLDLEHLEYFGLSRDPFALESDPRAADEAYSNKELDRIARRIENAVKFQGFLAVVGPVGAGKTMLKKRVADRLTKQGKARMIWPRFAEMSKLTAGGIIHYILEEFGNRGRARLPLAQRQLERILAQLSFAGQSVALCIDEAHRLNDATLSAFKNFYELGTGGYEKYLGIVFFGQPQLKTRLENAGFREIAERIEVVEVPPMSRFAADYIAHRISLSGGAADTLFEAAAIRLIAEQATTPLAIGNLANKALLAAYAKGEKRVLARFLERDSDPRVRQIKKAAA